MKEYNKFGKGMKKLVKVVGNGGGGKIWGIFLVG